MNSIEEKIFLNADDVADDLEIRRQDAELLIKELNARLVNMGGICIKGKVSAAFYRKMKDTSFTSPEGKPEPDRKELMAKRLLNIREFCFYAGMERKLASRLAKEIRIEKRIGRRVMYDRVLFDRWCDSNSEALCPPAAP